ncbi:glycosyltransferase family 39 protein [Streptomyces sp. NPDC003691]
MSPAATARAYVPASRPPPGPGRGGSPAARDRPLLRSLRAAAPALAGYLLVRLVGLAFLTRLAHAKGHGVWPTLATSWDSNWYLGIAAHGYAGELGTEVNANNLAFFPLYPLLIRAASAVLPGSRASAGLLLAVVCSFVAAWGVYAVGARLHGHRTGTLLAVLWGLLPVAAVQWLGYTESLFTALCAWSLYTALTGRWLAAGLLAALAGLTRPTGIALAAAVALTALLAARRARGRARALAVCGAVLAPAGWLGYVAWVGARVGRPDGYFAVQRLWKNEWDGGRATLLELRQQLIYEPRPQLFVLAVSACLVLAVVMYTLSLADRQPLVLLVFTGAMLVVVLGSAGVYFPRARFLLPAFPLLLPLALSLSRATRTRLVVVLASATLLSAWLGGYMLLVWPGPP